MKCILSVLALASCALAAPVAQGKEPIPYIWTWSPSGLFTADSYDAPAGTYATYGDYSAPASGYGTYGNYPAPAGGYADYGSYKE